MTQTLESQLENLQISDPLRDFSSSELNSIPKIRKISYIEVNNFKSYADYHYVGPFLNFSAVIGPNGGGKSNIVDALCFVLCVNPKSFRVYALQELIYRKEKLQSTKSKENRACWVSVGFQCDGNNTLKLRRSLDANGNSEFFIDDKKTTLEVYYANLHKNRINPFAKNFLVMQGEIDTLVEKNPRELTNYLEYISGSIVHKDEYDEMKTKLEAKESELKEQTSALNYLKSEKRKVKDSVENSNQYKKLLVELEQAELSTYLMKFLELDKLIVEQLGTLKEREDEFNEVSKLRDTDALKIQKDNIDKDKVTTEIKKKENTFETKKSELLNLKSEIAKLEGHRNLLKSTIEAKLLSRAKFEKEKSIAKNTEKIYHESITELEAQFKELVAKIEARQKDPSAILNTKQFQEYSYLSQKLRLQSHLMDQELEKLYSEKKVKLSKVEEFDSEIRNLTTKIEILTAEVNDSRKSIQSKSDTLKENKKELTTLKVKSAELTKKKEKKMQDRASLQKLREEQYQLLMDRELINQNQKEESANRELYQELYRVAKGFKGSLGSLVKSIQPKFDIPLKLAFGPALNYLVVDKSETAQQCNNILKDKSVMKDILVLENIPEINTQSISNMRNQLGGLGNLASDVADYERSILGLDKAVLFLLHGKVVCESLSKAEAIRKKDIDGLKQYITYDGTVIKKGVIVGHGDLSKVQMRGKLSNELKGNLDSELANLQKKAAEIEEKIQALRTDDEDVELYKAKEKVAELEGNINLLTTQLENLEKSLSDKEAELTKSRDELRRSTNEKDKAIKAREVSEISVKEIQKKISTFEDEIFGDFCKAAGISSVKQFRGQHIVEYESMLEEKDKLEAKIKSLRKEVEVLSTEKIDKQLSNVESDLSSKKTELDEVEKKLKADTSRLKDAEKAHEEAKNELTTTKAKFEQILKKIELVEKELDSNRSVVGEKEKAKRHLIHQINGFFQKKKQLLEELSIKSIEVPVASKGHEENSIIPVIKEYKSLVDKYFSSESKTHIDYSALLEEPVEEKEKNQDSSEASSEIHMEVETKLKTKFGKWFSNMSERSIAKKKEQFDNLVSSLSQKIDDYTMTSVSHTQDYSRKLTNLDNKIQDVKDEISRITEEHDALAKEFDEVKKKRTKIFDEFFEKLTSRIDEVYKSLTKSVHNQGGKAIIYKENQIESFNGGVFYSATPPSKRFVYDVEQLSGGEKTMAGLALLLTSNLVNGFPFMVFDESDAFLDQNNTKLLLDVITGLVEKKQLQAVVITHKNVVYESADSLVGATFIPKGLTSECFSLDMRK